jgi:plasmid stability protein
MAQVIVRHLEDETVRLLKERARRKGHSLERELREILAAAARQDMVDFKARAAAKRLASWTAAPRSLRTS